MKKWRVSAKVAKDYDEKIKPLLQAYFDGKISWEEYMTKLREITKEYTETRDNKKRLPDK